MSAKFDEKTSYPDDKSVHLSYPVFEFEPNHKEILFLIERAQGMKSIEDIENYKEPKRKPKLGTRNMMRVEQRSSSSVSHYSIPQK